MTLLSSTEVGAGEVGHEEIQRARGIVVGELEILVCPR